MILFYEQPSTVTTKNFCCKQSLTAIPESTFRGHILKSGLLIMKKEEKPLDQAKALIKKYVSHLKQSKSGRTFKAKQANRYLTEDEEMTIIQFCRIMSAMGQGLTRRELLHFLDDYVQAEEDERTNVECSEAILFGLFLDTKN